jgi:dTDP-4-amino-4,6-dideoxygalactose transaminase
VPVFPHMTQADIDYVIWAIKQCVAELKGDVR